MDKCYARDACTPRRVSIKSEAAECSVGGRDRRLHLKPPRLTSRLTSLFVEPMIAALAGLLNCNLNPTMLRSFRHLPMKLLVFFMVKTVNRYRCLGFLADRVRDNPDPRTRCNVCRRRRQVAGPASCLLRGSRSWPKGFCTTTRVPGAVRLAVASCHLTVPNSGREMAR